MKTIYPHTTFRFRGRRIHYSGPGEVMSQKALISLLERVQGRVLDLADWSLLPADNRLAGEAARRGLLECAATRPLIEG